MADQPLQGSDAQSVAICPACRTPIWTDVEHTCGAYDVLPQTHWVCSGCGGKADWAGYRKACGSCGSREREQWIFSPFRRREETP